MKHDGRSNLNNVKDIENFIAGMFPDGEEVPGGATVLALFDKDNKKGVYLFEYIHKLIPL